MIKEAGEVKGKILNKKEFWEQYRFIVLKHGVPKVKAEWVQGLTKFGTADKLVLWKEEKDGKISRLMEVGE